MHVAVRELKSRFSEYLRYAQAGEEVIVTTDGNPIARLVRFASGPHLQQTHPLDKLTWVRPGQGGKLCGLPAAQRIHLRDETPLSDLVLDDRA